MKVLKEFSKDGIRETFAKNKFLFLILIVGIVFILWPSKKEVESEGFSGNESFKYESFSLEEQERKFEKILTEIYGAGKVRVLLTTEGSLQRIIASDKAADTEKNESGFSDREESETVILDYGSSDGVVDLQYIYPKYTGAVVVAEGADDPGVKLCLSQAVAAATGLGVDKISIIKMANN